MACMATLAHPFYNSKSRHVGRLGLKASIGPSVECDYSVVDVVCELLLLPILRIEYFSRTGCSKMASWAGLTAPLVLPCLVVFLSHLVYFYAWVCGSPGVL